MVIAYIYRREFISICLLIIVFKIKYSSSTFDCTLGFWGSHCSNDCGHCEGGKAFCQVTDGLCVNGCARGYKGRDCKTPCPPGTHGQYCVGVCGACSDVRPVCDTVSGMCLVGCKAGYQRPYCKVSCPPNRWGDDCNSTCACKKPPAECSCHPETGACEACGSDGKPTRFSIAVDQPGCLNQFAMDAAFKLYSPPSVLNIPWVPVVVFFVLLHLFILTYYIYWWVYVRQVPKDEEAVELDREKRRQKIRRKQLSFYAKYAKENMVKYWSADWEQKKDEKRVSYERVYF